MRRWMIAGVVAALLVAAWAWFAREEVSDSASDAPIAGAPGIGSAATPASIPAKAVPFEASRAPAATARMPTPAAPLPPEDAPLAEAYDALAARARAGDNAAAMRLAFDLTACRALAGQDAEAQLRLDSGEPADDEVEFLVGMTGEFKARREAKLRERAIFCRGVPADRVESRGEWLRMAARRGDLEAMACYAAIPQDFAPSEFTDAWFAWAERWQAEAQAIADQAYARGRLDMLTVLATAYGDDRSDGGISPSSSPLAHLLPPDPVRGAAYAEIARRSRLAGQPFVDRYWQPLDAAQRRAAEAVVARDAQRFTSQEHGLRSGLPCQRMRGMRMRRGW